MVTAFIPLETHGYDAKVDSRNRFLSRHVEVRDQSDAVTARDPCDAMRVLLQAGATVDLKADDDG